MIKSGRNLEYASIGLLLIVNHIDNDDDCNSCKLFAYKEI